jgi:hypothetical protein
VDLEGAEVTACPVCARVFVHLVAAEYRRCGRCGWTQVVEAKAKKLCRFVRAVASRCAAPDALNVNVMPATPSDESLSGT